ncbi:hypothetical protein Tco_0652632 [Tanacetum coccineum]|uniref:Uncharacterized protein n=1 Tax=Tanacetum coccineum TaxID=301880 RepID=A0ABQ4WYG3_9ASTR
MSLFGQDDDTFTSTMLLNVDQLQKQLDKDEFQEDGSMAAFWVVNNQFQKFIDSQFSLDYDSQMTDKYFVEYTRIEVKHFRDTLLQHMGNVKKSVAERTRHQRQYDRRVNKRQMQTQESKIDTGKAVDADLVVTKSSGTESEVQDDSSRSGNDTDADDADIRPIYDEEPMAEVQLTAECNIFAIGQQHTEQLEISHEGRVDQYPEQCQVQSPMLDSSLDNQATEYSKQSLESENNLLKNIVAQFQKDFSRMQAWTLGVLYFYHENLSDVKALLVKYKIPRDLHPVAVCLTNGRWTSGPAFRMYVMDGYIILNISDPAPRMGSMRMMYCFLTNQLLLLFCIPSGLLFSAGLAITWEFPKFRPLFKDPEGNVVTMSEYLRLPFLSGMTIEAGGALTEQDVIPQHTTTPLSDDEPVPGKTDSQQRVEASDPKIVATRIRKAQAAAKRKAEKNRGSEGAGGSEGSSKRRKEKSSDHIPCPTPLRTIEAVTSDVSRGENVVSPTQAQGDNLLEIPAHDSANTTTRPCEEHHDEHSGSIPYCNPRTDNGVLLPRETHMPDPLQKEEMHLLDNNVVLDRAGFDPYSDKKMNAGYERLFSKTYSYVDRISHLSEKPVQDLLKLHPAPPPKDAPKAGSGGIAFAPKLVRAAEVAGSTDTVSREFSKSKTGPSLQDPVSEHASGGSKAPPSKKT